MTNVIDNIRKEIKLVVGSAIAKAVREGDIRPVEIGEIIVETPREKEHGDFSTNIAMQITRQAGKPPRKFANSSR